MREAVGRARASERSIAGAPRGPLNEHAETSDPHAAAVPATKEPLLTRAFVLLSIVHFGYALAMHCYLHLPGFLEQIGANEVEIGVLFSVMAAVAIVARPPVGRWMDTRGRREVILAAGALHVVVCAGYLAVTQLGVLLTALRALHGLAEAMMFASLFTYAADIVPASRRTEGLAIFGVSGLLPIAIGGVVGDAVLSFGTYRHLFLFTVALSVVALLGSLPLREHALPQAAGSRGFVSAATQRDLVPLWFMGTVFALSLSAVFIFLKTFVLEAGVGSVGLFFSTYAVSASLLRLFLSWIPDRFGPKRSLFPAIGVLSVGLLLLARSTTSLDIAVAGVLCGLGHGFAFPIIAGLVVTRARDADRGSALAIFTAVFDVGLLVGGPVFGLIIRQAGYSSMYLTAAIVAAAGVAIFAAWDRGR